METQTKAIEPVPGGMWQKRAAELLGAGVGAVNHWVRTYREGGMAALRPENRDAGQADKPAVRRDRDAGDAEACVLASWRPLCERCFFRSVGSGFSAGCAVSAAACLRCVGYLVMRACSLR